MNTLLKTIGVFGLVLLMAASCKNKNNSEASGDTLKTDSQQMVSDVVQHNFPEKPEETVTDTSFTQEGKKYNIKLVKRTIDSSLVVFERKAMGKIIRDVYMDYEYLITPKGQGYKGGTVKVTKHTFREEFNDEFFNFSVLFNADIMGYNESEQRYEFGFFITKPDTDNTFKYYFYITNDGKTGYEEDEQYGA